MKENYTIVIADDDPDDHYLFQDALKGTGVKYDLIPFYDGSELLDYFQKKGKYKNSTPVNPDVIILDIHMPILNGIRTLEKLKSDKIVNETPVYMLSTTSPDRHMTQANELGARAYYEKPSTNHELKQIITEILSDVG